MRAGRGTFCRARSELGEELAWLPGKGLLAGNRESVRFPALRYSPRPGTSPFGRVSPRWRPSTGERWLPFSVVVGCLDLAYLKTVRGELSHAAGLLERAVAQCREWHITTQTPIAIRAVKVLPRRRRRTLRL
jgi:hypothetical protein